MFKDYTSKGIKVIMLAQDEARRLGHNYVCSEQLLVGLFVEGTNITSRVLKSMGVTEKRLRVEVEKLIGYGSGCVGAEVPFTRIAKKVIKLSLEEARQLGHKDVDTEHLALSLLKVMEGKAPYVLERLSVVDLVKVRSEILRSLGDNTKFSSKRTDSAHNKTPTLNEFGTNLTTKAQEGRLDPMVGRAKEIERVIQLLGRRTKSNPILIGEPGVGKTAIAEGLAQRIVNRDIPETLEEKIVIALDLGRLIAGTKYRGEFEERLKKIMDEVRTSNNIILVIDEVHTLIGAGSAEGAVDAANLLKPALSRGEFQCIGATTLEEYKKYIEKDAALARRFQPVIVEEPSVEETIEILYGLREPFEKHHKLIISDEALIAAANFADQYIADRFLPDKAVDLIDEAGSKVQLMNSQLPIAAKELDQELKSILRSKDEAVRCQDFEKAGQIYEREMEIKAQIAAIAQSKKDAKKFNIGQLPIVTEEDIAEVVAAWTSVPVNKLTKSESERLLQIEATLHGRIIGQDEAVVAISRAIRRARVGLKSPNRPIASFIFSGPTGVGKTELCKALAAYFFGSEESMVRLDMSEYMERHSVSKLIGSPPGYVGYSEGGLLTENVRRRPYAVVLFDEIEKGHPDVFNLMLQIFEDGRLTDSKGRKIDFTNTLLIMTSNIGSKIIERAASGIGFELSGDQATSYYQRIKSLVHEELKDSFRPEFLNRLDEIIVFRQLTKYEVGEISEIMLKEVSERVSMKGIQLEVTDRFKTRLIEEGYNPIYGARPLRRAVMTLLEDNVAEAILDDRINSGDIAVVDIGEDNKVIVLVDRNSKKTFKQT